MQVVSDAKPGGIVNVVVKDGGNALYEIGIILVLFFFRESKQAVL